MVRGTEGSEKPIGGCRGRYRRGFVPFCARRGRESAPGRTGRGRLRPVLEHLEEIVVQAHPAHSAPTASVPRKESCQKPRARLIWPLTGSTAALRRAYSASLSSLASPERFRFRGSASASGVSSCSSESLLSRAPCRSRRVETGASVPSARAPSSLRAPVSRVGRRVRQRLVQMLPHALDHRHQVPVVRRLVRHSLRHDHLRLVVHRQLRVVSLHEPVRPSRGARQPCRVPASLQPQIPMPDLGPHLWLLAVPNG